MACSKFNDSDLDNLFKGIEDMEIREKTEVDGKPEEPVEPEVLEAVLENDRMEEGGSGAEKVTIQVF